MTEAQQPDNNNQPDHTQIDGGTPALPPSSGQGHEPLEPHAPRHGRHQKSQDDNAQPVVQQPVKQPEYGQFHQPEYGAMDSQFPPNYNPYIFGHDEQTSLDVVAAHYDQLREHRQQGQQGAPQGGQQQPYGQPSGDQYNQPYGQQYPNQPQHRQLGMTPEEEQLHQQHLREQQGYQPKIINGIDVNDPNQNPLYGHWDFYSICALITALLCPASYFTIWIPIVLGIAGIWRTKTMHMKGFGLAVAAVVLGCLALLVMLWMTAHGLTPQQWMEQVMQMMGGPGSGSSVSA